MVVLLLAVGVDLWTNYLIQGYNIIHTGKQLIFILIIIVINVNVPHPLLINNRERQIG